MRNCFIDKRKIVEIDEINGRFTAARLQSSK